MSAHRQQSEPETRVGHCAGCRQFPIALFKVPGVYRYRCAECFRNETGFDHHLAPARADANAIAASSEGASNRRSATPKARVRAKNSPARRGGA